VQEHDVIQRCAGCFAGSLDLGENAPVAVPRPLAVPHPQNDTEKQGSLPWKNVYLYMVLYIGSEHIYRQNMYEQWYLIKANYISK
jgi:hypothetical protein